MLRVSASRGLRSNTVKVTEQHYRGTRVANQSQADALEAIQREVK